MLIYRGAYLYFYYFQNLLSNSSCPLFMLNVKCEVCNLFLHLKIYSYKIVWYEKLYSVSSAAVFYCCFFHGAYYFWVKQCEIKPEIGVKKGWKWGRVLWGKRICEEKLGGRKSSVEKGYCEARTWPGLNGQNSLCFSVI